MDIADLPALNAILNATAAVFLSAGYMQIRRGRIEVHKRFMLAALTTSALFLISYLVYHANTGSRPFPGDGVVRLVYFTILISHTVLAVAIVPLVLITVTRALRARYDRHRRIARITLPLWAYVSVTGVVVYWMLYRL